MFKKLHRKVLLLNTAITLAVLLIAFGAVYAVTLSTVNAENQRRLDAATGAQLFSPQPIAAAYDSDSGHNGTISAFVAIDPNAPNSGAMTNADNPYLVNTIVRDGNTGEIIASFSIEVDDAGDILRAYSPFSFSTEQLQQIAQTTLDKGHQSTLTFGGRTWLYEIVPFSNNPQNHLGGYQPGRLPGHSRIVFLDITDSMKTLQDLLLTFLFVGLGMLAVIFCVSYFFTMRAIKPVSVAWEKQRKFVADASHELKTPLATMMTNYDVVLSNEESTVASQKEWLGYLRIGMDRMNRVISNLLSLAKLESGELTGEKSTFDLSALIADSMQQMESQAQEKNLSIISKLPEQLLAEGNEDLTEQAFSILFDNALKYADEGGTVEVLLQQDKKHAMCTVKNTGKGISPEELPHIFDRFYRADAARTSEDNSHGLGLPIALAIVEQLGGSIKARSEEGGCTEFVLTLKL